MTDHVSVTDLFGSMVFDEATMKSKLPKETFKMMQASLHYGKRLDPQTASVVANAMKDWAIEKGATHYTHWFQPMTGITAEKHDSFISPTADGKIIMEFSGKELVRGEPDASSFPSGGLRATFEARGYTAWDPTSFAFIRDNTLYIPTAFCSYGGEALDQKTPLLRSMEVLGRQAQRILRLFGAPTDINVKTTVGPEQEYFLIDEKHYAARPDLRFCGRTLIGAKAPKGQEMDDHYFGTLKPRIKAFMAELDEELWKLGVLAKTEHNEGAPAQHELAPIFSTTNIACDHNQITMDLMQKIARRHGLVCLLHEKPFLGVNGSGKHNNWSMTTNAGQNLLEPGDTPHENAQFLLFLVAVIKAVDDYQDLLRISVASAGNDHRLGAHEAPPAIVSMFIGDELAGILDAIEAGSAYNARESEMMRIGVHVLPKFPRDTTDRNRTSPFAFTGNKFEFRSLGSSASPASVNIVINTAVAQVLGEFADVLESADNFNEALNELIRDTIRAHKRILFNGNGYDAAWIDEAKQRGLSNYRTTPEALAHYLDEKNIALFENNKVFSRTELAARKEINEENYCKVINIEARTMIDMIRREILPAAARYKTKLSETLTVTKAAAPDTDLPYEEETLALLSKYSAAAFHSLKTLEGAVDSKDKPTDTSALARFCGDIILPLMEELRCEIDAMEPLIPKSDWPYPTYGDMLFYGN
ncbi:MAG: glutamine synthetase III [Clostridia bacterium]|nr:glutamine synthetase III [Clostridia bacterium]